MLANNVFCAALSSQAGEPVFGTASRVDVWFLLEYNHVWPPQVLPGSHLPPAVKDFFSRTLKTTPHSKLQFIKGHSLRQAPFTFFVAVSSEQNPRLYQFEFSDYAELLGLNLAAVQAGAEEYAGFLREALLWLVCTHGRHDKCCAKFGFLLYKALRHQCEQEIWQTSHVGGDRFAANVISLPWGIYYGHVGEDDLPGLLAGQGQAVYLDCYRGRTCYNFPAQAADYFLRRQTGELALPGFHLEASQRLANTTAPTWDVTFSQLKNPATRYTVRLYETRSSFKNYLTCHDSAEKDVPQYYLVDINQT